MWDIRHGFLVINNHTLRRIGTEDEAVAINEAEKILQQVELRNL